MPTKTRSDKRTLKLRRLEAEIVSLKTTFKHWYSVGAAPTEPCNVCGYPVLDAIHKDKNILREISDV